MSRLARLTLITVVATFVLVTVGGLVRATDSGLGCADHWPGCNGELIPDFTNHTVVIEFSHRVLASIVGFMTLGIAWLAFKARRTEPTAFRFALGLVPLLAFQGWLGRTVVVEHLEAYLVVAHLGGAMAFTTLLVLLATHLTAPPKTELADRSITARLGIGFVATVGLSLLGSWVTGRHAGLAFTDWPLMAGSLVPDGLENEIPFLQFIHRAIAGVVGAYLVYLVAHVSRHGHAAVRRWAHVAAGLFGVQVLVGGANVLTKLNAAPVTTHLALSVGIVAALAVAWDMSRRHPARSVDDPTPSAADDGVTATPAASQTAADGSDKPRSKVMAYVALTKPRIIELLLVTTVPTMVVAQRGWPSTWLVIATVVGGALAAGGANAINMYVDRDIDKLMERTKGRPLVTGEIAEPRNALIFALGLEVAAFVWLWGFVNLLSAVLALSATLFYVFVYTLWLKRTSSQNIVIGGAAGAVPVLVGWSAVTGSLGLAPWVLFAIIFVWTPPHFWALAIRYRDDYEAADVPMLPVVESMPTVARNVVVYTVLLWAVTLVLTPVADLGDLYLTAALILGALFTGYSVRLLRVVLAEAPKAVLAGASSAKSAAASGQALSSVAPKMAMGLFGWSITYLTLLFVAMAADQLV